MKTAQPLLITLLAAGLVAVVSRAVGASPEGPPNIIFLMADDLGYADLGCYGQTEIATPHIDRLAAEGMRFTQCYAGSPVCAPSRSVLMTGQHTGHTTVRGNEYRGRRIPLRDEDITVAEVLKAAGYTTGMAGKWGLGEPGTTGLPNRQGFDQWFGYLNQKQAHNYFPAYLWHNEDKVDLKANHDGKEGQYSHDLITDFALAFVREQRDERFFLYVPWCIPHAEFEIPDVGPYADRPWPEQAKIYAAMVSRMDADVGRIVDLLTELKIDEKTIVFFCSDNGAARFWKGVFDSSGPLRGRKRDLWEGGLRVPMIARWPGVIPPGTTSDQVWYFADFLPTAAALAETTPPARIDGVNVLPTLLGQKQDLSDRTLYWEFFEAGFQQAIRRGPWKAVRLAPEKPLELYNLDADLRESSDVANAHPDVLAQLESQLAAEHSPSPYWGSARLPNWLLGALVGIAALLLVARWLVHRKSTPLAAN